MHRTRKTIIQRLKSIIRAIRTAISTPLPSKPRKQDTNRIPTPVSPTFLYLPTPIIHATHTDDDDTTLTWERAPRQASDGRRQLTMQQAPRLVRVENTAAEEVYLPGPVWDALNPTERFASVADLGAHLGDQLPVQVVKLIARDVLRALAGLHRTRGAGHLRITQNTILLSPTDLRALISQLRAETQTSLRPSELAIGMGTFYHAHGSPGTEASAVFLLADPDCRDRIDCMEDQALKPPEILLGAPCGTSADMWTLGCIIFELLTGETLFDPAFQTLELGISHEESHIIQMIEVFGGIPVDLIQSGTLSGRWFTEDGALRIETSFYPTTLECLLERHLEKNADVSGATAFLGSMLRVRPEDRARPEAVIDHHWFTEI